MKIVVAEDSVAQQALFRSVLDGLEGAEVSFFRDGLEAYRAVDESPPDLLVSDIMMPGLDGVAMVRLLKFQPRHSSLRVLVCSSMTDPDVPDLVRRSGADAFLPKPFQPTELLEALWALTDPASPRPQSGRVRFFP